VTNIQINTILVVEPIGNSLVGLDLVGKKNNSKKHKH